jgi:hypothetical protein
MNRTQRRAEKRHHKKTGKGINEALAIVHSVNKMVQSGAMELNLEENLLYILPDLFWLGKSEDWRRNFAKNMLTYFNMQNAATDEKQSNKIELWNLVTGTQLATFENGHLTHK